MKNKLFSTCTGGVLVGFSACSSDKDDNPSVDLVGKWVFASYVSTVFEQYGKKIDELSDEGNFSGSKARSTVEYKSDGTVVITNYNDDDASGISTADYKVIGSKLVMTDPRYEGDTEEFTFSISGNTLALTEETVGFDLDDSTVTVQLKIIFRKM